QGLPWLRPEGAGGRHRHAGGRALPRPGRDGVHRRHRAPSHDRPREGARIVCTAGRGQANPFLTRQHPIGNAHLEDPMASLRINGTTHSVVADDDIPLLWVLRDELRMTGTKFGCGIAQCGACTVHVDGRAARACVTLAAALPGREIVTIEGVTGDVARAVQETWRRLDVAQCGYCQSGQIMSAIALLSEIRRPSDADIDAAMTGNVCRCATYVRIRAAIHEAAPADAERYNNLAFGPIQLTGGSTAMANSWEQMRRAGATARAMLVEAAAREWGVPTAEITVDGGVVSHAPSGRRAAFGELASKAAALTPPAQVTLKDPKDFKLVGKELRRVDGKAKTDGSAQFTLDFELPGMLTALIARPPRFGVTVKSFDATAARRVKGVTHVVPVPSGVAVVAGGFWAARKGREALRVTWDESRAETRSSDELYAAYRVLAGRPGTPARREGDVDGALRSAARVLEAVYEFPYLAHAPIEPLDAV